MEAVKNNFLLRGYFNKKKKAEAKKLALSQKRMPVKMEKDSIKK
jgi:phospholipid/cholesterol/gamma-HCH transport system substrate-binding protein